MGGRTAIKNRVTPDVYRKISDYMGVDYQFNLYLQRYGLSQKMEKELQGIVYSYCRRPFVYQADPVWTWTFPRLDREPLSEFGAWCSQGCPVTVEGQTYTMRPLSTASASTDRVWRVDSISFVGKIRTQSRSYHISQATDF